MKAKATIERTYTKQVTVEFDYEPGLDPIEEATAQVLYTQKVEDLFAQAAMREIDDVVKDATWEDKSGLVKELNKYT